MSRRAVAITAGAAVALGLAVLLVHGCFRLQTRGEPLGLERVAPEFSLQDAQGRTVTLSGALRRGPALVVFYRGHW